MNTKRRILATVFAVFLLAMYLAPVPLLYADERFFTYTYEPKTLPKGALEFEQWITLKHGKVDQQYNRWELREEFEYGLEDNLTTALYLNFRSTKIDYKESSGEDDVNRFEFKGVSSEWKYKLADATADPLGFMLYGEVTYQGDELELEEKLVFGKNVGNFVFAYNFILEQEWEYEAEGTVKEYVVENTVGASYRVSNNFALGVEARNHRVFTPTYSNKEGSAYFIGPVVHYSTEKWWITATFMPQVFGSPQTSSSLELDEHTRAEFRIIFG